MEPKRVLLRRVGVVALAYVVGSIVLAKFTWGSRGPGIVTPFAFAALFVAAVALMGVALVHSQELVDEMEASRPPRVRNRGGFARKVNPMLWTVTAKLRRLFREWRAWIGPTVHRELTRDAFVRRVRALRHALSGVPPAGVSPAHAGRLTRPGAARLVARPRRIGDRHRAARRSRPREEALATLERLRGQRRRRPTQRIASETVSRRTRSGSRS
jgi:hypothetical protein